MPCALRDTRVQVLAGHMRAPEPVIASRECVALLDEPAAEPLHDRRQHDAVEFVDRFFRSICATERGAGRCGAWAGVQNDEPVATHLERVFGFVHETRRRCECCPGARTRYN